MKKLLSVLLLGLWLPVSAQDAPNVLFKQGVDAFFAAKAKESVAAFDKLMKGFAWLVQSAPNAVFEVDEATGTASGRVAIVEQFKKTKGGPGSLVGVYHDRYRRSDGAWRFERRDYQSLTRTDGEVFPFPQHPGRSD